MADETPRKKIIIAIDGPAGAGKTTAAAKVAETLGYVLLSAGGIYRSFVWLAQQAHTEIIDRPAVEAIAREAVFSGDLVFENDGQGRLQLVYRGRILGREELRRTEISRLTPILSDYPAVCDVARTLQRQAGARGGVVLEGRRTGTDTFPRAELKIFLTASAEARAKRRYEEIRPHNPQADYNLILADIRSRDHRDETLSIAPLHQAPDAISIDSSRLSSERVVATIVALAHTKTG